jgi:ankyrin repeat protein
MTDETEKTDKKYTPLWYAVENGKYEEVQALLKAGAKVNMKCG